MGFLTIPTGHVATLRKRYDELRGRDRCAVVTDLGLVPAAVWGLQPDSHLFNKGFDIAVDCGILGELWNEVNKYHTDKLVWNPFTRHEDLDCKRSICGGKWI